MPEEATWENLTDLKDKVVAAEGRNGTVTTIAIEPKEDSLLNSIETTRLILIKRLMCYLKQDLKDTHKPRWTNEYHP